jgi:hypothetical protein
VSSSSKDPVSLPFSLDATVPARPVSFVLVQKLASVLGKRQPLRYSEIVEHPVPSLVPVYASANGKSLSRASRYHHWNALRILGGLTQVQDGYILSDMGRQLAKASPAAEPGTLSPEALAILCSAVRSCPTVHRNLLVLFTGDPTADAWSTGKPVGVETVQGKRAVRLNNPSWQGTLELTVPQTYGILWGLGQWCRSLGLMDEILIKPQADVDGSRSNILFPVDPDRSVRLTVDEFDTIIRPYFQSGEPAANEARSLSIPLLFYRLCPEQHIALKAAKDLLSLWLRRQANGAWVQAPSAAALQEERLRRGNFESVWRKQQEAFLVQGGTIFTKLLVSARLGTAPVEPDVPWPHQEQELLE